MREIKVSPVRLASAMISALSCCCVQSVEDRDIDVALVAQKPLLHQVSRFADIAPNKSKSEVVSDDAPVKAKTFDAVLELTDGLQIGLGIVRAREKKALKIKAVQDSGAAVLWNINHPDQQIERDCYITQVNGVSGNTEEMIAECAKSNFLVFKIQK